MIVFKRLTLFLLSFVFSVFSLFAQLSGSYTINPAGGGFPNFTTFSAAIDSLESQGISASVVFNVSDGFYDEQFIIDSIPGTSATDTIIFQSVSGDSTLVFLAHTYSGSGDNYIVQTNGADYITFKGMSFDATAGSSGYGIAFLMNNGGSNNIRITNCEFFGKDGSGNDNKTLVVSYVSGSNNDNFYFANNKVSGGARAIGARGLNGSTHMKGWIIENNEFYSLGFDVMYIQYFEAPIFRNNFVDQSNETGDYVLRWQDLSRDYKIESNRILAKDVTSVIYLNECDGISSKRGLIANNFISHTAGGNQNYSIELRYIDYLRVYHNSIYIDDTYLKTSSTCFYSGFTSSNIDVSNNIFANFSTGYAYYVGSTGSSGIVNIDNNNYFTTGNYLAYWAGADLTTLAALATANGDDGNSVSANPVFVSTTDLHTNTFRLEGQGADLTSIVPFDYDGDARSSTPDIGADEFTGIGTPLSGTYTIGGISPDFLNFTEAVDSLNKVGVSGPVTFNVRDASSPYNEQISILEIAGADNTNTIVFQPDPANSGSVTLQFSPTSSDNYLIQFLNADYVTVKNMTLASSGGTYTGIIHYEGNSHHNSIIGCTINGSGTSSTYSKIIYNTDNSYIDQIIIDSNIISNNVYGISLNANDNNKCTQLSISRNTLSGQSRDAITLNDFDAPVIMGNNISNYSSSGYSGLYIGNSTNDIQITNNIINTDAGGQYGVYLNNCIGSFSNPILVGNNFISIGGSGSSKRALYTNSSAYVNIYNNSINIYSSGGNSICYDNNNGSDINIVNNILANYDGNDGYTYKTNNTSAIVTSDYNNLFTVSNIIAYWTSDRIDLAALQAASGKDVNSISANPNFISNTDLHTNSPFIDNAGTTLSEITDDIDGEVRSGSPDIGADEFTSTLTPMAGTYTIGGASPDYSSFASAIDDLNTRGISASVTFNVRNGNYIEQLSIYEVAGANASDTILFQSESGNASSVVLTFSASSASNYTLYLRNADYVTLKAMTISSQSGTDGRVIRFNGNVHHINITDNILSAQNTTSSDELIYSNADIISDIYIHNNIFSEGQVGVYLIGYSNSILSSNTVITGNTFSGQSSDAIYLTNQDAPIISYNNITNNSSSSSYEGINLSYCDNNMLISNNKIYSNASNYGIHLNYCDASFAFEGKIVNNFISMEGSSSGTDGININNSTYQNIYHNSVYMNVTNSNSSGIYLSGGNNINIENNIFTHFGNGRAYYINTTSAVVNSNYNDIYTTGALYARWGSTDVPDLATLKTTSFKDANSISIDPQFVSNSDLHINETGLEDIGNTSLGITTDFDDQPRDATPDIGADERGCPIVDAGNDTLACRTSVQIGGNPTALYGSGSYTYSWTPTTGLDNPAIANPTADPSETTVYIVTVIDGTCNISDSITVYSEPTADFVADVPFGPAPLNVNFTNNSTSASSYLWNFGDGSPTTGTENPNYVYSTPGNYDVTLIAFDATGTCKDTMLKEGYITSAIRITGQITTTTGDSVFNWKLRLYDLNSSTNTLTIISSDSATNDHEYLVQAAPGTYILYVIPNKTQYPDLIPTYYESEYYWVNATSLTVAGDTSDINIEVIGIPELTNTLGRIDGLIEEGDIFQKLLGPGDPMEGQDVSLIDKSANSPVAFGISDGNGQFKFTKLPPNDYEVIANVPGVPMDPGNDVSITETDSVQSVKLIVNKTGISTSITTSISEIIGIKVLRIYPNPVQDVLYFEISNAELSNSTITFVLNDLSGRKVFESNPVFVSDKYTSSFINLPNLGSGIYTLSVFDRKKGIFYNNFSKISIIK